MSGGASQLFDPEQLQPGLEEAAASGPHERPGVYSIGTLYDEVEAIISATDFIELTAGAQLLFI